MGPVMYRTRTVLDDESGILRLLSAVLFVAVGSGCASVPNLSVQDSETEECETAEQCLQRARAMLDEESDESDSNRERAVALLERSLVNFSRHPKRPQIHQELIDVLSSSPGKAKRVFAERARFVALYGPGSSWEDHQRQEGRTEAVRKARPLVRDNLISAATWFHAQARAAERDASTEEGADLHDPSREHYATAARLYRTYFDHYADDDDTSRWQVVYANSLFSSGRYERAYEAYRDIRDGRDYQPEARMEAAHWAVESIERRVRELVEEGSIHGRRLPFGPDALTLGMSESDTSTGGDNPSAVAPQMLPGTVRSYVRAVRHYADMDATRGADSDFDTEHLLNAGIVYYGYHHFEAARRIFERVVQEYSGREEAGDAARWMLETYRREGRYLDRLDAAERLARSVDGIESEDLADAFERRPYQQACEAGDMRGCVALGSIYERGLGQARVDDDRAQQLYRRACDAKNAAGCHRLGSMFERGRRTERDYEAARAMYEQACEESGTLGCYELGELYRKARGGERDYGRSRRLFANACSNGSMSGCIALGDAYRRAEGVERDYERARRLYRRACDREVPRGCGNLGHLYVEGLGVERDTGYGRRLLERACESGHGMSCLSLALLYEQGRDVAEDRQKTSKYYRKACEREVQGACGKADASGQPVARRITREILVRTIATYARRIATCRDERSRTAGPLVVRFEVTPAGRVTEAFVRTERYRGTELGRCTRRAVKLMKFPETEEGGSFEFPFPAVE